MKHESQNTRAHTVSELWLSAVSAAEHLFRSTQWAHAWHDGFHWAQITHNWVRSWLVCSSKKQCKTARKNKSGGCEMAKGCCSLFNEASQHSRWFSRCYLPILQMHTSGLCKIPSQREKLKERRWDVEVLLLLPANWLQSKRIWFFLIKIPPKEKQPHKICTLRKKTYWQECHELKPAAGRRNTSASFISCTEQSDFMRNIRLLSLSLFPHFRAK